MPPTLQYAHHREVRPWGPIFFWPSWRSCLLLILLIGSAIWLRLRHDPWRLISRIAVPSESTGSFEPTYPQMWFTSRGQLRVSSRIKSVRIYDPFTGARREIWQPPSGEGLESHVIFLPTRDCVLVMSPHPLEAPVIDVHSGQVVQRVPNLLVRGYYIRDTNDDLTRVIAEERDDVKPPMIFNLRDSAASGADLAPLPGTNEWGMTFCDDHRFIEIGTRLMRASDLLPVRDWINPAGDSDLQTWFSQTAGHVEVYLIGPLSSGLLHDISIVDGLVMIYNLETGQLLHRLPFSWKSTPQEFRLALTDDESRLAVSQTSLEFGAQNLTEVWDLKRGISMGRRIQTWETVPVFIPHSHEILTVDTDYEDGFIVCESPAAGPTALIPGEGMHAFSRDGNLIAFYGQDIQIFQRVGRECRESTLGILGMPHTWLLLIAGICLFISLCLDARRTRISALPWSQALGLILLALGAVCVSLFMLLRVCLGQRFLTPAPLLLVVVIGLCIDSRFWRFISIFSLAAACIWCIDQFRHLHYSRNSFSGSSLHWILDRRYEIPDAMLADMLLFFCAICLLMLLTLLLNRHHAPTTLALPV